MVKSGGGKTSNFTGRWTNRQYKPAGALKVVIWQNGKSVRFVGRRANWRYTPARALKLVKMVKPVGSLNVGLIGGINLQGATIGGNGKNGKAGMFSGRQTNRRYKHAGAL